MPSRENLPLCRSAWWRGGCGLEAPLDFRCAEWRALWNIIFGTRWLSTTTRSSAPVETSRVPECTPGTGTRVQAEEIRDWYRARATSQLARETQFWLVVVPLCWRSRASIYLARVSESLDMERVVSTCRILKLLMSERENLCVRGKRPRVCVSVSLIKNVYGL